MHKYLKLIFSMMICQAIGLVGSLFTFPSIGIWYASLNKPAFTPPNWLFGPVWLTLYFLMGISLWLVWNKGSTKQTMPALYSFSAQLNLNAFWSLLFFGFQNPLAGLIGIVPLSFTVAQTIRKFYGISKNAAYLLVPYILWLMIATYLNFGVCILN